MISSQLGTEARPRVFFTGLRAGGRPRNPALDEAIILATRARLVRDGYSRMTLGDIAADAGVSRPTLYRRWRSKFDLVADALDYGFRKQRDLYDIDLSRLEPRDAVVEAVDHARAFVQVATLEQHRGRTELDQFAAGAIGRGERVLRPPLAGVRTPVAKPLTRERPQHV